MQTLKKIVTGFCLLLLLWSNCNQQAFASSQSPTYQATNTAPIITAYGNLPLSFQPNFGQTDEQVKFLSRGQGYTLFLTQSEAVLALSNLESKQQLSSSNNIAQGTELKLQWLGTNSNIQPTALQPLPGKVNYFVGSNPQQWHTDIPTYAQVQYSSLYPGIDLVYYGNQGQLEYDLIVAPKADPQQIKLKISGAQQLQIDQQGQLLMHTPHGVLQQHKPVVYQIIDGDKQLIEGNYVLSNQQEVGIALANYDHEQPLVIDPVIVYSTYLGSGGADVAQEIAVDTLGNAYILGETASTNFPSKNALQSTGVGAFDVFVTKLNPHGNGLVYSTYLAGSDTDYGGSIAVDLLGNAYITGTTASSDFPLKNAFQSALKGSLDGFITKLNSSGNHLAYSTYLGGSGSEGSYGIVVDTLGNTYVTGATTSSDFPRKNAFQTTNAGGIDVFVTKLNPNCDALIYSTFLGGNGDEVAIDIAINSLGNAYVTGVTTSSNLPLKNAYVGVAGGQNDAFVTKFDLDGDHLVYSTYLGGSGNDYGASIAVNTLGNAYVVGTTNSTNFPLNNALQNVSGGQNDVFVTKFDLGGNGLVYSTYLGGSDKDNGTAIDVDTLGNAYIIGTTASSNFPKKNAFQNTFGGIQDAFVTKINSLGNALVFSSYLGGSGYDQGRAITLGLLGNIYVTGATASTNFPKKNAFQSSNAGSADAFITKISP
ncbi:SBBP repeat-containing protein [Nostoc sp. FACHB-973]|nr:SBBP repeat-containing protein [Nostoc sp. FACHB-973]